MSNQATKKPFTVLPYTLGGKDDPAFIGDGNPPCNRPFPANETEDIGGNWTPDRIEANEDRYGKPWYEREDWEVPGNGGTNDHLFEDDLFEEGDPQEYGDGSPD